MGVIAFSFSVGSLTSLLSNFDELTAKLQEKYSVLETIGYEFKIAQDDVHKIKQALRFQYMKNDKDKYDLLTALPPQAQMKLSRIMNRGIRKKFKFFTELGRKGFGYLILYLRHEKISKGEYIYKQNDPADCVYFLVRGEATFSLPNCRDREVVQIHECKNQGLNHLLF